MPPNVFQQPHRPGPLHQTNKTHKGGRHSRKSSATSEIKSKSIAKPLLKRREDRLNQLNQTRKLKREKTVEAKRKLGIDAKPPITVGLLDIHMNSCEAFLQSIRDHQDESAFQLKKIGDRMYYVVSSRLKMRFRFVLLNSANLDESLDLVKTQDIVVILHKSEYIEDEQSYEVGQLLRAIKIHCMPTLVHVLEGIDGRQPNGARSIINAKRILRSRLKDEKLHSIETSQDYLQLFNILGSCKRQRSQFKAIRSTLAVDTVDLVDGNLSLVGFVREGVINPNDLVHVVNYGDYQIKQIEILPDPVVSKSDQAQEFRVIETLTPDLMRQESLEQENDLDPMEGEQTWPTAEELAAEAEKRNTKKIVKRLPPGTSEYQGAWITDGSEEEQSEDEHESDEENSIVDDDVHQQLEEMDEGDNDNFSMKSTGDDKSDVEETEGDDEDMAMDVDEYDKKFMRDKEQKILEKLREARMDEMYPDEVDTPADIAARVRFARYRGLKSFRTSAWDPQENLPPDYSRIFQFKNFHHSRRRVINEKSVQGADPGQYVRIILSGVDEKTASCVMKEPVPPTLICLLKHERKMTVMNLLIKRLPDSDLDNPIKSKDELIFFVGFRKFKANPLFTNHSLSAKFKYERFLRDDVAMVATMYAPITFPPAPVLVFRMTNRGRELVASGSVLDSNPNRLIVKRIRLSGHPFKIHSKTAVIRFMFFNADDVLYFKPVELVTKYNRRGHISEPLGTHGHMKCTFDKKIRSDDCIFMNLYKRVFPKWTYSPINRMLTS